MFRYIALALFFLAGTAHATTDGAIKWESWSDGVFERAKQENRFVLMDLEAVWCHWCHVMNNTTYSDPKVIDLIKEHYIPVRVDQDARPDISRRYENWGWPATVVFAADGTEIVKRRGYMRPEVFISILEAIVLDPSPINYGDNEPITEYAQSALLDAKVAAQLEKSYYDIHDPVKGGFKQPKKYIDWDTAEYAMLRAKQGDAKSGKMVRQTLDSALKLIDPVWGGVYQYSTHSDWGHAHFEKIMSFQAEYVRIYALAYAQFGDPRYLKAANDIYRYVKKFLTSPEGVFYVSQDADLIKGVHSEGYFKLSDAQRRKLGMPAIDKHRYARENGWMIHALAILYTATGEHRYLDDAVAATRWIVANRALPGGGFRHDDKDIAGPYLEDTLSMGRAFIGLYLATAERQWLERAANAAAFIDKNFRNKSPGYVTSVDPKGSVLKPKVIQDENILLVRFANLLYRYTGAESYRNTAEHAMRYIATEQVALRFIASTGTLLAGFELANDPLHITIVGPKNDAQAKALFQAAIRYPSVYRRVEWWDKREGEMPNPDVQYPDLPRAAAFVCTNGTCSLPIYDVGKIATEVERALHIATN
jgi:uncharacterized protein YyaL (SSP411 family)